MHIKTACPESDLILLCRRNVPAGTARLACLNLLDWLGCVIAAQHTPVAVALNRAIPGHASGLLCKAVQAAQADPQTAALAFGALGNVLEMDDLHRGAILHAGDTICAAALAVGLNRNASGTALLVAITRGYEVAVRIGLVAASGGYTPFYNSGTCGVFGAAMAAADLRGLDAEAMGDALGQAGMQASGIWQCRLEPTFSKQLACAHAARAGVLSADLAVAGFPGARRILTGPLGFFASYYPQADPGTLTQNPADNWALHQISFKPFPACRHTHPAISAALDLPRVAETDTIARVAVHTYGAARDFCDKPVPTTPHEARFSLQHCVAIALTKGAPEITDFDTVALTEPQIERLRHRIIIRVDPALDAGFPAQYAARLTVTLTDGSQYERVCPAAWGDPENPMSQDQIIAKFHRNTAYGGIGFTASDALCAAVLKLPDASDLGALRHALTDALSPAKELA